MEDAAQEDISHPEVLTNQYPESVSSAFSYGMDIVQQYGWFLLAGFILAVYFTSKLKDTMQKRQQQSEDSKYKKYDPDTAQSQLEAMETSRQRMQERFNAQAAAYAEEKKRKEEEKRKQKIEEWDRHLEGKGYHSRYKPKEEENVQPKPKPKKPLRQNDYNPLMGDTSGGACFRVPRRGASGGG